MLSGKEAGGGGEGGEWMNGGLDFIFGYIFTNIYQFTAKLKLAFISPSVL